MNPISPKNKVLARMAHQAFGGLPNVSTYWDDEKQSSVDVLVCENVPESGVMSLSTLGLSDHPLMIEGEEFRDSAGFPIRIELVAACGLESSVFANILATAAFCIIRSGWFCEPGAIFPNIVATYLPKSQMKHLLFVSPFPWQTKLSTLATDTCQVAWLMAIPISEEEYQFALAHSTDKLQQLLEKKQANVFDLQRHSVV